jgi:hypothetical protein
MRRRGRDGEGQPDERRAHPEWHDHTAVTLWRDGAAVASGSAEDRATALQDAWIPLIDSRETNLAAWVASEY